MKKNIIVIIYCFALILISELPTMLKPFLVHSTGTIKIIGYQIGVIVAICILLKWKIAEGLLYISLVMAMIADFSSFIYEGKYLYLLFLVLHLLLLLFFVRSKSIKEYLQKGVIIKPSVE